MQEQKKDIKSFTMAELAEELQALGEKRFRAAQVFDWLHKRAVTEFSQMTNLSASLREKLEDNYTIVSLREVRRLSSAQDETVKFLFALPDDKVIESVFIKASNLANCSVSNV